MTKEQIAIMAREFAKKDYPGDDEALERHVARDGFYFGAQAVLARAEELENKTLKALNKGLETGIKCQQVFTQQQVDKCEELATTLEQIRDLEECPTLVFALIGQALKKFRGES